MHTHFLLASKSVEHTASVKRRRNNNNNNHHHHQHRNIKGLILLSEFLIAAVFVYAQRAHMRSHSLWFSFLAFCFRFVRLSSVCMFCTHWLSGPCATQQRFELFFSVLLHCRCIRYEWRKIRSKRRNNNNRRMRAQNKFAHMLCTAGFNKRPTLRCFFELCVYKLCCCSQWLLFWFIRISLSPSLALFALVFSFIPCSVDFGACFGYSGLLLACLSFSLSWIAWIFEHSLLLLLLYISLCLCRCCVSWLLAEPFSISLAVCVYYSLHLSFGSHIFYCAMRCNCSHSGCLCFMLFPVLSLNLICVRFSHRLKRNQPLRSLPCHRISVSCLHSFHLIVHLPCVFFFFSLFDFLSAMQTHTKEENLP